MARPANLAQASQSPLGEMDKDSPKPYYAKGRPSDQLIILSERVSRTVCNSLESLGETSGLRFSGRDVIPWPLLVGVHGGAPSV
ncbi:hypothetical protein DEO72_LG11g1885 [Vigna unguiculata]|uniref:Uncharacterized protein n=1 Tax=Vigna unguiculata TaxID=3917 RepID=A0A4D6NQU3_VIGUN|nr:hypothetical protein DEO72_LG11g1885 [Vigna unguiculata]